MKFIPLMLLISSCMSATVHRDEWLACCQRCDRPANMNYVTKSVYDEGEVLCHCLNDEEYYLD